MLKALQVSNDPIRSLSMDCLESTCNRKGWSEMVVISWKIKLEKVKD